MSARRLTREEYEREFGSRYRPAQVDRFTPTQYGSRRLAGEELSGSRGETPEYTPTSSGWSAFGRSLLDAATFGFDDELLGYTGLGELFGLGSLEEMRARKRQLSEEHPWLYGGGQLAGFLIPMGAGAKILSKLGGRLGGRLLGGTLGATPEGAGLLSQVGYGAAGGALHGAGSGEGMKDTIYGALIGAGAAGVGAGAVHAALGIGKPAWDYMWGKASPEKFAGRKIAAEVIKKREEAQLNKLEISKGRIDDATEQSLRYTDLLSSFLPKMVEQVGKKSGIAREHIKEVTSELPSRAEIYRRDVLDKWGLEAPEIFAPRSGLKKSSVAQLFEEGNSSKFWDLHLLVNSIKEDTNGILSDLYTPKLLNTTIKPKKTSGLFDKLINDETIKIEREAFDRQYLASGMPIPDYDTIGYWHAFKGVLNDKIEGMKVAPKSGDIQKNYVRLVEDINTMLKKSSPTYGKVTHMWHQYQDAVRAIKHGIKSFDYINPVNAPSPQALKQAMEGYAVGFPRAGFKVGFADSLRRHVYEDVINNRSKINELTWESANVVLGEERTAALRNYVDLMKARAGTYSLKESTEIGALSMENVLPTSKSGLFTSIFNRILDNPKLDEKLVELSLKEVSDADTKKLILKQFKALRTWQKAKDIMSRVAGLTAADITGRWAFR